MAIGNTEIKRKSRAKLRAELGDEEYKRIEAQQRKERRKKQKERTQQEQPLNPAVPSKKKTYTMYNQPTRPTATVYTIDDIHQLKLDQAVAKGRTIKRATVEEQYNNIIKLHKLMFNDDMKKMDFLRDTNNVFNFINTNDKWSTSSKNKIIQSISSVLSVLPEYKNEYKIYSDISTGNSKQYVQDKGDIINVENYIQWNDLKDLYKKPTDLFDKSLISIYTILPPRRVKDIQLMTITHSSDGLEDGLNYILLDGTKPTQLIYQNYKTQSVYGVQTFDIPAKLSKILQEYINSKELKDGSPLFPNRQKTYYKNFGEIITKTFKKYIDTPISANVLRHSFIIDFMKIKRTPNERKKIADQMAHSIEMQSMYDRMPI
jgi:hypothetical protein